MFENIILSIVVIQYFNNSLTNQNIFLKDNFVCMSYLQTKVVVLLTSLVFNKANLSNRFYF